MGYETLRVLIWGKTYPELSSRYTETVCTGGVLPDGTPIRLYPVPLRYLDTGQQYKLYDWIEVPASRNPSDPRPESYKVRSDDLRCCGCIPSDPQDGWRRRREVIFKRADWQFGSVGTLMAAQRETKRSMGIVTPGRIEDVRLVRKPAATRAEYESKWAEVCAQGDLFRSEYKELEYLPYDIRLCWRCVDSCEGCERAPHDMKALDWGLLELARREGWEKARDRLAALADPKTHDFRLFMGNFRLRPWQFGIIGLWYPKHPQQPSLL